MFVLEELCVFSIHEGNSCRVNILVHCILPWKLLLMCYYSPQLMLERIYKRFKLGCDLIRSPLAFYLKGTLLVCLKFIYFPFYNVLPPFLLNSFSDFKSTILKCVKAWYCSNPVLTSDWERVGHMSREAFKPSSFQSIFINGEYLNYETA